MRHVPLIPGKEIEKPANDNHLAMEVDGGFFGRHRWRRFYARPSFPGELDSWGPLTHHQLNWILVRVARNRRGKFTEYQRIGVSCPKNDLPDDERFLERLWQRHEALKATYDGKHYEFSQDEIKALTAGLEVTDD